MFNKKEYQKEYQRAYYSRNKEKIKKRISDYSKDEQETVKETKQRSWLKNKDKQNQRRREWKLTLRGCLYYKLRHLKKAKRARILEVDIDIDFLSQLWESQGGKCAISGYPMTYSESNLFGVSIDRIDCQKGYTQDNVQLVCQAINFGKNKYTNNEMIEFWNFRDKQKENNNE
jgi:hypothetical protein